MYYNDSYDISEYNKNLYDFAISSNAEIWDKFNLSGNMVVVAMGDTQTIYLHSNREGVYYWDDDYIDTELDEWSTMNGEYIPISITPKIEGTSIIEFDDETGTKIQIIVVAIGKNSNYDYLSDIKSFLNTYSRSNVYSDFYVSTNGNCIKRDSISQNCMYRDISNTYITFSPIHNTKISTKWANDWNINGKEILFYIYPQSELSNTKLQISNTYNSVTIDQIIVII